MRVLVLGASGSIGFLAAQALICTGHLLTCIFQPVVPIVGEISDPTPWVEIVIDAVGRAADIKVISQSTLDAVSRATQATCPPHTPRLNYVYTSRTWIHGDNRTEVVTDTAPLRNPTELVAWLPAQEQCTIHDPPGTPGGRYALIHTDDLADMYVLACEKTAIVGGVIFDAVNEYSESVDGILSALVKVSGAKGYEYREPADSGNPRSLVLLTVSPFTMLPGTF
ncbi:hypothetical protein GYMLUDRAFT_72454 [Collybiopsis luxurians FD-317 M1]|uniref:Uncharacterized protein n=1 Tax=Collybiopsis luxurians FD-317 M1 TaxID=944289 RepID=A0A0D0D226_9AGAR|nr:hypothetical protein GYMLUDRAFT_72454 [Collybiopsis luxurians FD-317 M1]